MSHLEDRLAEFVLDELGADEMETARRHVAQCLECQRQVSVFQKTLGALGQLPSEDVPRRLVFVPPAVSPVSRRRFWPQVAWAAPPLAAALALFAILLGGGVRVDWSEGTFAIAMGPPPGEEAPTTVNVDPAAVALDVDYDQLDYARIAAALEASPELRTIIAEQSREIDEVRLRLEEIDRSRDGAATEIERLRAGIASLYDRNQLVERRFYDQNAVIQLMASRLD